MQNEEERQRYILDDTGFIVTGSFKARKGKPWKYGQYEHDILDVALYVLDATLINQSDPLLVSDHLAHGVIF